MTVIEKDKKNSFSNLEKGVRDKFIAEREFRYLFRRLGIPIKEQIVLMNVSLVNGNSESLKSILQKLAALS